jgi:hypothetical protein
MRSCFVPDCPLLAVNMIVACPAANGVTTPAALTVAIEGGLAVHDPVIVRPSDAVAVICSTRPKKMLLLVDVTDTEKFETGVDCVGEAFPVGDDAVGEESPPQAIVEVRAAHTTTLLSMSILSEGCPTGRIYFERLIIANPIASDTCATSSSRLSA